MHKSTRDMLAQGPLGTRETQAGDLINMLMHAAHKDACTLHAKMHVPLTKTSPQCGP
jgi:hypothetical protein